MRNALNYARDIFGTGNAFSIVILGIEPRDTFIKSLENIMKDGIVPTLNIYHYDPLCSTDMDITDSDVEEIIEIAKDVSTLFKSYGTVPGDLGCAHYDIGHEIEKGYF